MYLDRIEERYLQEQHQYFCAIREEMAKQDVILRVSMCHAHVHILVCHIQVIRRFAFADSSTDSSLGLGPGLHSKN